MQRPPLIPILVAPAITPASTPQPMHIPDPPDSDRPPFPSQPPPLAENVLRKTKSFNHRKSFDATLCRRPTKPTLQSITDEPSTFTIETNLKTASDLRSETIFALYPKLSSSLFSTSSIYDYLNCGFEDSLIFFLTSSSQKVTPSNKLRSRPTQSSSYSRARTTSSSISALLPQHVQPRSSTSGNSLSCLSGIQFSLKPSTGMETSFTVHSNPRSNHLTEDGETVSSLSAINAFDFPYHSLDDKSIPHTPDLYQNPMRLDNQTNNLPRRDPQYHVLPVNRINNKLQNFTYTRNRELKTLT